MYNKSNNNIINYINITHFLHVFDSRWHNFRHRNEWICWDLLLRARYVRSQQRDGKEITRWVFSFRNMSQFVNTSQNKITLKRNRVFFLWNVLEIVNTSQNNNSFGSNSQYWVGKKNHSLTCQRELFFPSEWLVPAQYCFCNARETLII